MRTFSKYFFCVFLILKTCPTFAQQPEANIWYFGRFMGLDFSSGVPVPLNDGKLNTDEGVATISDANGKLLFYTDGSTIYNRLHGVMPNGTGLFGNYSSTQSAVIVPKIGDNSRYYVFTVDATGGPRGLTYSIVNMTLDNGRGDVESKNIPLQLNVTEKVTAVRHCNNRDIWVLAHGTGSNTYYAFLVTTAGIISTPVISNTGAILPLTDSATLGYLKASPDGKRLAAANWTINAEVSDFNNQTGVVSNTYDIFLPSEKYFWAYGIEFSSNSQVLYTTAFYTDPANAQKRNALFQFDLSQPTPAAVRASRFQVAGNSDNIITMGALQVATDGKMYMSMNVYQYLSCVNNPNVPGAGCNFTLKAVQFSLPQQKCSWGLPTFVQSYFYPTDSFTYVVNCPGNKVNFNYEPASNVRSFKWDFGDPASGANNSSSLTNPVHDFSTAGNYTVQVIKFTECGSDTLVQQVSTYNQQINLGNDTTVCSGTGSILLHATVPGNMNQYLWQDGSTDSTLRATTPGLYWVEVRNSFGCIRRDSINVNFQSLPVFNLGADTSLCAAQTLTLNATVANATRYLWSNGTTAASISVSQVGTYWCEVFKNGCSFRDSLQILSIKPNAIVDLGNDQTLCEGVTATLDASFPNSTYLWQNGSTNATYTVSNAGTYSVEVSYNGCKTSDTVVFNYNPKPHFTLGPDQYICPGNTITLKPALDPGWQLQWQDGSSHSTFLLTQPGNYSLMASNNCGVASDEIMIGKGTCKVFVPTGFTPNNDGKNDKFKAVGTENVTLYHMKVFNRWGELVFETNDKLMGWDGKFKGVNLSTDVFIYLLQYKEINSDQLQMLKGTMTLIR